MNTLRRTLLVFLFPSALAACAADTTPGPETGDRGPIGKADAAGSCALPDGGETCGGINDAGTCWCDDLCAEIGDCCSDKATVCDGATINLCDSFEGPCQSDDDCGDGFACVNDPSTCSPSACGCDPVSGNIMCTADCGGSECVPAEPIDLCDGFVAPCSADDDCGDGMVCVADPSTCSPSACGCDPDTGSIICTEDCGGKECVEPDLPIDICDGFVGPCQSDDDCGDGFACINDPSTCSPSACGCDSTTGSIICTQDCGGSECVPA